MRRALLSLIILLASMLISRPTQAATVHPLAYHPVCTSGPIHCLSDVLAHPTDAGFGPDDLRSAYALPSAPPSDAPRQTIGIVDAYDDPTVEADLAVFDTRYGVPACTKASGCLTVTDQRGGNHLPTPDMGWAQEISLDVQIAHGLCPSCHILLVEADRAYTSDLSVAEDTAARLGATEISNSWGSTEGSDTSFNRSYSHPGVAVTVSSGDEGYGVSWPASIPDVLAVGGTSLYLHQDGTYSGESAWSGSGSGCSGFLEAGAWQTALPEWPATHCADKRGVADVAADADPNTGFMVYHDGDGWQQFGGTSLSSPIIASIVALAGGVAGVQHPASLPYLHRDRLNDVLQGSNGRCDAMCTAREGYDGPTGLGSPNGTGAFDAAGMPPPPPTATPTPTPPPTVSPTPGPPGHPRGRCAHWGHWRYFWSPNSDGTWQRYRTEDCTAWVIRQP